MLVGFSKRLLWLFYWYEQIFWCIGKLGGTERTIIREESATFLLHCFFACSNCFLSFQSKSSVLQISKRYALLVFWKMKPKWNQTRTKFKCDFLYAGHLWILIVLHNLSVWEIFISLVGLDIIYFVDIEKLLLKVL